MNFTLKAFDQLNANLLFEVYKLRAEVFIVEQNCAYQDVDDKDTKAFHFMLHENGDLVAYCRILPPGVTYRDAAIGRVVVPLTSRGKGYGKLVMQKAIEKCTELFASECITISAQTYLKKFYEDLGFAETGEKYLEDNIPHMKMKYTYVKT